MPRENYDYLSDETRDALTDNVKAMAAGWDKSTRYIYQILEEEKSDPFPAFESMYRGAAEGGVSTDVWDRKLAFHRENAARRRRSRPVAEVLAEKVGHDNGTTQVILQALLDGRIDDHEIPQIRKAVAAERRDLDEIDRLLNDLTRVN